MARNRQHEEYDETRRRRGDEWGQSRSYGRSQGYGGGPGYGPQRDDDYGLGRSGRASREADDDFGERGFGYGDEPPESYRGTPEHYRREGLGEPSGYRSESGQGAQWGRGGSRQGYGSEDRSGSYGRSTGAWGYRTGASREDYPRKGWWDEPRSTWDRTTDEISSWFGDNEAARRRELDQYRGRSPKNYTRSDERIREDVCDALSNKASIDPADIDVSVQKGEVTLSGTVCNRDERRYAEDCAEYVSGVKHVQNNLRIGQQTSGTRSTGSTSGSL